MRTAGIIAEYNPFHNGHAYQIAETRRITQADFCVAVMSGDFVQRGAPAVVDKYERTRMALENGIDVVIELPVVTALSSAEAFAEGAVSILAGLGVVTDISFGAEISGSDDFRSLQAAAELLTEEPAAFRASLSDFLKKGYSFPAARAAALRDYFAGERQTGSETVLSGPGMYQDSFAGRRQGSGEMRLSGSDICQDSPQKRRQDGGRTGSAGSDMRQDSPQKRRQDGGRTGPAGSDMRQDSPDGWRPDGGTVASLLGTPNNILAVEYLKALRKYHYRMRPLAIPRAGSAYHETRMTPGISSASAIRALLKQSCPGHASSLSADISPGQAFSPVQAVPETVCLTLTQAAANNRLLWEDDFSSLLYYALTEHSQHLNDFGNGNRNFTSRLLNHLEQFSSWSQFAALLKTRDRTYTSVSRYFAHVLIGIRREHLAQAAELRFAPYARILGFRKSAAPLLKEMREKSRLHLLAGLAGQRDQLNIVRQNLLDAEIRSCDLYNHIRLAKSGIRLKNEYRQPLICL